MSMNPFTTSPNGGVDFSVSFENVVFGMLPAALSLVVILIFSVCNRSSRSFCHGRRSAQAWIEMVWPTCCAYKTICQRVLKLTFLAQVMLISLVSLHLASLITSSRLSAGSLLDARGLGTASYVFRLLASLGSFICRLLWNTDSLLVTNLYLLVTCIADGVRVHTLWRLAQLDPLTGFTLPALQTAIMMTTALSFFFSEFGSSVKSRGVPSGSRAYIDEPGSGTCEALFFGWLWPLLRYGLKNKLVAEDLKSSLARPVATYTLRGSKVDLYDAGFWASATVQFLGALLVRLLGAGTLLAQPFIINGIVSFLQGNKVRSVGVWLVVGMFFK